MTLRAISGVGTQEDSSLFLPEPPPMGGHVPEMVAWADRQFTRLAQYLRQPEFGGLIVAPIALVLDPATKLVDGLTMYAAAGVITPTAPAGLYVRIDGAWRRISTVAP